MDELLNAYLRTEIIFRGIDGVDWGIVPEGTPGSLSRPIGALGLLNIRCGSALIITGWNPLGVQQDTAQNEDLQNSLIGELGIAGIEFIRVVGQDPGGGWKEESLLIANDSPSVFESVMRLAEQFEQNAIFELTDKLKRVISVRMPEVDGSVGYRLLPWGTN